MTVRVYTMARDGIVTVRHAMVAVLVGEKSNPYALGQAWPPCQCPRQHDNRPDHFRRT
ncbi:hypothetical protein [Streptomyces rugosispiralis]|uniref:Uncharacterized protein n=1 Tax=Streptomyces rugosispiralis TaxID=2967341 RepID=A0ABT1V9B2_9ACTN|nr:hypothetical protein [Streptomyces rugosispiralis]MCQ8193984.1 hypothetical protein [Streptomyces rugosispiralis]